ncbi:hypothetical protein H5411_16630 [Amycolatopsis echigonensis]|uniref:ATP/GTP-binding protein n=1 Tax=Amycolatopsis echigonensis TaxID=2576905 RepID=A0A2N3WLL3_9PSEU|nr:hypothetical protein [Amycolatopsis echigonensis]MCG3751294.1 hypothetical protein [Amycolatopsis sp. Poz14]PKV94759.1 hypothetical protein ATK30_5644 [Amycolatopsis niigatensis]
MLRRAALIAGTTGSLVLAGAAPALAGGPWGSADCQQTPSPACQLGAGQGGTDGTPGRVPSGPGRNPGRQGGGQHDDQPDTGDRVIGPNDKSADCGYQRSDYRPPAGGTITAAYRPSDRERGTEVRPAVFRLASVRTAPLVHTAARPLQAQASPGQGPGAWYLYKCSGPGFSDALYRTPIWIPDSQAPGPAPLPSPAELAQAARNQLRLPSPTIAANPRRDQLVALPTWLWLSSGWDQQSATASVPGVSVTAVAKPTSLVWSMGDGSKVTCGSGGTPFPAKGDPKAASPDCGHTYRTSSAGQPNNAYPVTATVHWAVSWSGAGQSGTFPDMTTTGNAAFRVAESQALNTGGR